MGNIFEEVGNVFDAINMASGSNAKKQILNNLSEQSANNVKIFLTLAYDPYIKFGVTRVNPELSDMLYHELSLDLFLSDLDRLVERKVTGHAALKFVATLHNSLPPVMSKYLERILKKDLKIGLAEGLINDVFPGLIPEFKLALCERFKKVKDRDKVWPSYMEPKEDGVRSLIYVYPDGETKILARSGIPFENYGHIESEVKVLTEWMRFKPIYAKGIVLDGEIKDSVFQNTMSNARRIHNVDCPNAKFFCWDIMPLAEFEEETCTQKLYLRKWDLKDVFIKYKFQNLSMLPYSEVESMEEVIKGYEYWALEKGEEGVIIKNPDSDYLYSSGSKRGKAWWKFKQQDYAEQMGNSALSEMSVVCTGYYNGDKDTKNEFILGGFTYKTQGTYKGCKVIIEGNCGGGLKDAQRFDFWNRREELIGLVFDVEYQEVTQNKNNQYSLRFPIFKGFRFDIHRNQVFEE